MAEAEEPDFFNRAVLEVPAEGLNGYRGFATDAGGTLIKLAYTEDDPDDSSKVRLHLGSLANDQISRVLQFSKQRLLPIRERVGEYKFIVRAAGWGNMAVVDQYTEMLGAAPEFVDEFNSYGYGFHHLIDLLGPRSLLHNVITCPAKTEWGNMRQLRDHMLLERSRDYVPEKADLYPALIGFIGSGVGFVKIEADGTCSDIHLGSMTGGMFFWGMGRVLTHCKDYDELQSLVEAGNPGAISDVLSDIPPGMVYQMYDFDLMKEAFSHLGDSLVLPFGKLGRGEVEESDMRKEDLVATLLHTICYEIMEQAVLFARWHGAKSLFFAGSFLRNNKTFSDYVQRAPLFDIKLTGPELIVGQLKYEGYISALGCLLLAARQQKQQQQHKI